MIGNSQNFFLTFKNFQISFKKDIILFYNFFSYKVCNNFVCK
jgi:hypothetical protein